MLESEKIIELREEIKAQYPVLVATVPPDPIAITFTDEQINLKIPIVWLDIPITCRFKYEILKLLTIHRLLEDRKRNQMLQNDSTATQKNIQSVKALGDITTTFFKDKNSNKFDPSYDTTDFGTQAKILLRKCSKRRVAIIR